MISPGVCESRRRFITEFAAKMTQLEVIKLECGIPKDEVRETLRALSSCPLRKIVLIGTTAPLGNTWAPVASDPTSVHFRPSGHPHSIPEDIILPTDFVPSPPENSLPFTPDFGRHPRAPLLHEIATKFASTITELKFVGFRGCPVLWDSSLTATIFLAPLRHFHALKDLVLSFWLDTSFEDDDRDMETIAYWLDARDANRTALTVMPDGDESSNGNRHENRWARELAEKYEPSRIAHQIAAFVGPLLSERAKSRGRGVHVRGSFCLGITSGMFDFDVWIGKNPDGRDAVLEWKGPREELEPSRRREKLESRRWF